MNIFWIFRNCVFFFLVVFDMWDNIFVFSFFFCFLFLMIEKVEIFFIDKIVNVRNFVCL